MEEKKETEKYYDTEKEIEEDQNSKTGSGVFEGGKFQKLKESVRPFLGKEKMNSPKDMLKVAVISQEASYSHARKYWEKIEKGEGVQNPHKIDEKVAKVFRENVAITTASQHKQFLKEVLKNKRPNHVIAVVEGERDVLAKKFSFKDISGKKYSYKLREERIEGKDKSGRADAKQNMHFYVREDMEEAIKIKKVEIPRDGERFPVGKINFSTTKDEVSQEYSLLTVHIPNRYAGTTSKDTITHQAFKNYAQEREKKDEIVVGYIGDTNYFLPKKENTQLSYGGIEVKNKEDSKPIVKSLFPDSSGAQRTTYFMQAVPLNNKNKSFGMKQPNILNICKLAIEESKVATDHPSMQTSIFVDGRIDNRLVHENKEKKEEEKKEKADSSLTPCEEEKDSLVPPSLKGVEKEEELKEEKKRKRGKDSSEKEEEEKEVGERSFKKIKGFAVEMDFPEISGVEEEEEEEEEMGMEVEEGEEEKEKVGMEVEAEEEEEKVGMEVEEEEVEEKDAPEFPSKIEAEGKLYEPPFKKDGPGPSSVSTSMTPGLAAPSDIKEDYGSGMKLEDLLRNMASSEDSATFIKQAKELLENKNLDKERLPELKKLVSERVAYDRDNVGLIKLSQEITKQLSPSIKLGEKVVEEHKPISLRS